MSGQLAFKWNNHTDMINEFKNLLSYEVMVDVTLVCEEKKLKAHKIILSAFSPFFRSLFLENPCTHPILILTDVKYSDLKTIIEFIYCGEITVAEDRLSPLVKTAEKLKIKGLGEIRSENNDENLLCDDEDFHEPEIKQELSLSDNENMEVSTVDEEQHNNSSLAENCEISTPNIPLTTNGPLRPESPESSSLSDKEKCDRKSTDPSSEASSVHSLRPCVVVLEDVMRTKSSSGITPIPGNQSTSSTPVLSTPPTTNSSVTGLSLSSDNMPTCSNAPMPSQDQNRNCTQGGLYVLGGLFNQTNKSSSKLSDASTVTLWVTTTTCTSPVQIPSRKGHLSKPALHQTLDQTSQPISQQSVNMPSAIQSEMPSATVVDRVTPDTSGAISAASTNNTVVQQPITPLMIMDTDQQQANASTSSRAAHTSTIWEGTLEFYEMPANSPDQIASPKRVLPCTFSSLPTNRDTQLADKWPDQLTLHFTASLQLTGDRLSHLLQSDDRIVLIHFDPDSSELPQLRTIMSTGRIGYILFPPNCNYRMMIVIYSLVTRKFMGFIRCDQKNFRQTVIYELYKQRVKGKEKVLEQPSQSSVQSSSAQASREQPQSSTSHDSSSVPVALIDVSSDESVVDSHPSASHKKQEYNKKIQKKPLYRSFSSPGSIHGYNNIVLQQPSQSIVQPSSAQASREQHKSSTSHDSISVSLTPIDVSSDESEVDSHPSASHKKHHKKLKKVQKTPRYSSPGYDKNNIVLEQPSQSSVQPSRAQASREQHQSSTSHDSNSVPVTPIDESSDESVVDSHPSASHKKQEYNIKVRKKPHYPSPGYDNNNIANPNSRQEALNKIASSKRLVKKIYKCRMCFFKSVSPVSLVIHINNKHKKKKNFTPFSHISHQQLVNEEKPFHCNLCPYKASKHYFLDKHIKRVHHKNDKPFKCEKCDFKCSGKTKLKNHMTKFHNKDCFVCLKCDYQSDVMENVKRHIEEEHEEEK